jgi:aspartate racemase
MGPEATLDFITRVMQQSKARSDQEHLRLLIDHNPRIPNRHAAIHGEGEAVGPQLAAMARGLERAGADFLVMVCNTAHAFQQDIEAAVSIPFVSIVDQVLGALKRQYPDGTRVGVMAAEGCLHAQLYQQGLQQAGYNSVLWNDDELSRFMGLLYRIKAGDTGSEVRQGVKALADILIEKDASVILAGCTEIPLVLDAGSIRVPVVDSTDVLVTAVIEYSCSNQPI